MAKNTITFRRVSVNSLRPNTWNTNSMSPPDFDKLVRSIEEVGSFKPVVVRRLGDEFEIIGGEHRWKAAMVLGWDEIDIADLGEISEAEAKRIGVLDNERYGEDDELALARLIEEIDAVFDVSMSEIALISSDLDIAISSAALDDSIFDGLDDDSEREEEIERTMEKLDQESVASGQMMRFKVPNEYAGAVRDAISAVVKSQGIKTGNDMEDAGEALAYIIEQWRAS
ncbi:ParB/RepB/Spo0J family partition protein [Photobacterium ganghwense]|uniref:ParB-like N-terminal domain-containing protein n=1 Tax=Photobacterium ganghwense TaxID=320778 RepID=A0A0J1HF15_9GAMM|nr:ParB/RepB/Spo0J family partition protein [Photobacterium ganghwense]KLV10206.1 hypothetical protein ABT57_06420 [Photobacterium ganghwense]PSU09919.1 chromosome partitioning protein ParB [Photobacterium ganghwense]